jgi:hypothetical protein
LKKSTDKKTAWKDTSVGQIKDSIRGGLLTRILTGKVMSLALKILSPQVIVGLRYYSGTLRILDVAGQTEYHARFE